MKVSFTDVYHSSQSLIILDFSASSFRVISHVTVVTVSRPVFELFKRGARPFDLLVF